MSTNENLQAGPTAWMRRLLEEWLPPNAVEPAKLMNWLRGRGLPALNDEEEPYVWILRGLPKGAPRAAAERAVATALAKLLDDEIDRTSGPRADKPLYNAFKLAAGLSDPDALGEPLHRALGRATLTGRRWRGHLLTDALRGAVIENQLDARYEPIWRSMLAGKPHPYLGGSPTSGFDGILWMPPSARERGRPAVKAIGRALRCIAQYLDSDPELQENRAVEFKTYLERVRNAYPGGDQISDKVLLQMADAEAWPWWAVQALHNLALIVGTSRGGVVCIVPSRYAPLLGLTEVTSRLCHGELAVTEVPESEVSKLQQFVEVQERERRKQDLRPSMIPIKAPKKATPQKPAPTGSRPTTRRSS